MLTIKDVQSAYRKLKQFVYYDKTDLFLRLKIAKFECGGDYNKRLRNVEKVSRKPRSVDGTVVQGVVEKTHFSHCSERGSKKRSFDNDQW